MASSTPELSAKLMGGPIHSVLSLGERFAREAQRWLRGRTLAACADGAHDNILPLRLLAALMVIFGHSVLAGPGGALYQRVRQFLPGVPIHEAGLFMFFTISGFLITLSFERRPELVRFLRARALRLLPALVACVFAWAFVFGPLLSTLPLHEYFSFARAESPLAYFWGTASLLRVGSHLPGVFEYNAVLHTVNASLWSIPIEAKMYLCVAAIGMTGLFRRRRLAATVVVFACGVLLRPWLSGAEAAPALVVVAQCFFGAGAIVCLLRRHVPVSSGLMVIVAAACALAGQTRHALPFSWLAIGYFVLWFSYVPRVPRMPRGFDFSYGIYLWGWPVQQTFVLFGVRSPGLLFALASPLLVAIGALSWLCIEQPALRWKNPHRDRVVPVARKSPS